MRKNIVLFLSVFFMALECLHASLSGAPVRYNFFTPNDTRGGFGDLMANIWLAQRVKHLHTESDVHIHIDPTFIPKLKILFPSILGVFASTRSSVAIQGITYHWDPEQFEDDSIGGDGQLNFSFSFNHFTEPYDSPIPFLGKLRGHSLIALDEYGYPTSGADSGHVVRLSLMPSFIEYTKDPSESVFSIFSDVPMDKIAVGLATGPTASGLYIDPVLPRKTSSLQDFISVFKKSEKKIENFEINRRTLLGLSYSDQAESALVYLRAAIQYASLISPEKIAIIIIDKQEKILLDKLRPIIPTNLSVAILKSIPFEEMDKVIQQTNFPILMTGDMSATQALQYEKPFFYEESSHKNNFLTSLQLFIPSLVRYVPEFRGAVGGAESGRQQKYFNKNVIHCFLDRLEKYKNHLQGLSGISKAVVRKAMNRRWYQYHKGEIALLNSIRRRYREEKSTEMLDFMKRSSLQREFVQAIQIMRPWVSLVEKMDRLHQRTLNQTGLKQIEDVAQVPIKKITKRLRQGKKNVGG